MSDLAFTGTEWLDCLSGGKGEHAFFGVDGCRFKLDLFVFEAIEDPDDGYRSHLDTVEVAVSEDDIFFANPIAHVRVEAISSHKSEWCASVNEFEGWRLVDVEDGHEWLVVGTDRDNVYYPCFVFRYTPKEPKLEFSRSFT